MNIGIQDAIALAEALSNVIAGDDDEPLSAYNSTRRPIAERVVLLTDRLTRVATVDWQFRSSRNALLRLLSFSPAFRRSLAWRLSGLVYR